MINPLPLFSTSGPYFITSSLHNFIIEPVIEPWRTPDKICE